MPSFAHKIPTDPLAEKPQGAVDVFRVPQITLHAFCDTPEMTGTMESVATDRRMSRAHVTVHSGGVDAAVELYRQAASPNAIIIESRLPAVDLHAQLDKLADVCVPGTKLIIIGYSNDIALYRELLVRGVSEYIVAPVTPIAVIAAITRLYQNAGADKLGRSVAFIGAKGGVGSSTIAHNVASMMGRAFGSDVILADLDLPFGSAGLGFDLDTTKGMAQALQDTNRLDYALLEHLLTKCEEHLSVLSAPATLEKSYDLEEDTFERILDIAQSNVPFLVLDVPHVWTSWVKRTLLAADEVVITAIPDLVSLRNAKNLVEQLKRARPNDAPPRLVLNQVGMPKRSEIAPDKFSAALQIEPLACIPFEPSTVSAAANKGQMIADVSARSAVSKGLATIAHIFERRAGIRNRQKAGFSLARLWRS
jgi:pilus assembly protein CpaE